MDFSSTQYTWHYISLADACMYVITLNTSSILFLVALLYRFLLFRWISCHKYSYKILFQDEKPASTSSPENNANASEQDKSIAVQADSDVLNGAEDNKNIITELSAIPEESSRPPSVVCCRNMLYIYFIVLFFNSTNHINKIRT